VFKHAVGPILLVTLARAVPAGLAMVLFDISTDTIRFVAKKCAFARQEVERAQTSTCIGTGEERDGFNQRARHVHSERYADGISPWSRLLLREDYRTTVRSIGCHVTVR
jgi:hypothetical protein